MSTMSPGLLFQCGSFKFCVVYDDPLYAFHFMLLYTTASHGNTSTFPKSAEVCIVQLVLREDLLPTV